LGPEARRRRRGAHSKRRRWFAGLTGPRRILEAGWRRWEGFRKRLWRVRKSTRRLRFAREEEVRQFRETCTTIDDFNRDLADPAIACEICKALKKDEDRLRELPIADEHRRWLLRFSWIRDAAGALSRHLQPRLNSALRAVFFWLAASVLMFHVYAHWEFGGIAFRPLALVAFLAFLVVAIGKVIQVWWTRLEERRLDSRALAEALRVRRAWSLAGIGRSVADSYISQLRGEVSWIRLALLHTCPPPKVWVQEFDRLTEGEQRKRLDFVRREWVRGQVKQFERAPEEAHHSAWILRFFGIMLALAGWLLLVGLLFFPWNPEARSEPAREGGGRAAAAGSPSGQTGRDRGRSEADRSTLSPREPPGLLLIVTSSLVIAGGLLIAYCERKTYEELAKQYERMRVVFDNGDRELESRLQQGDIAGAQRVIEALGHEAILEHSQWLIFRRARPLELHIGG
jgi:hypothetical protein